LEWWHNLREAAHDTIADIVERADELAGLPIRVHAHMLRHGTGYPKANRGIDTRIIQSYLGTKIFSILFVTPNFHLPSFKVFGMINV
jgi:site-specific recombinase XerD